jgi:hypothetical protein
MTAPARPFGERLKQHRNLESMGVCRGPATRCDFIIGRLWSAWNPPSQALRRHIDLSGIALYIKANMSERR